MSRMSRFLSTVPAHVKLPIVIPTSGVPVHLFTHDADDGTRDQLVNLAESGIAWGYVAGMPDVHLGKGATVGSVFCSTKAISPYAVGSDIGCGMVAVPFPELKASSLTTKAKLKIQSRIKRTIPTSFNVHDEPLEEAAEWFRSHCEDRSISDWLREKIQELPLANQLGTLGGGNHFIEVLRDEHDRVWAMIHSGSRRIGKETCDRYDRLAKEQMLSNSQPVVGGLHYLLLESRTAQEYLSDMTWCQRYAHENRRLMLDLLCKAVREFTDASPDLAQTVNIHHNYAQEETVPSPEDPTLTNKVWVTRKGATSAREGELGIIPGSMGTGSFIVRGKGNAASWSSCSHGAGRTMSRTKAKKAISQKEFEAAVEGIICDRSEDLRDEAPQAYKDLSVVMANQADLIDVVHRLLPIINVKGFQKYKRK